ncbi:GNAT family N-acetyltransferase [Kribbella sp. CA-294648]|uniref:GNAT family N-acetyltransferase n=1 Tax=Kribbella sp. CA-294648 TaxID=3239948 RepID=UPI003D8A31E3
MEIQSPTDVDHLAPQIWPVYATVFGDFESYELWRADLFDRHAARAGYRLLTAVDGSRPAGTTLAGFGWGYTGQRGQFWSDLVCNSLPKAITDEWVGGHFEVVELAVLPEYRGQGVGRALHDKLLESVTGRCLLSTSDDPGDPAVRLYLSSGWRKLGVLRPGVQVMGRSAA